MVVVIAGPDGVGKSTLVAAIQRRLAPAPVRTLHHRPHVLPRRSAGSAPVTDPHGRPPYGAPLSLLKTAYLFIDFMLGWLLHLRPASRRGELVLIERGWWDLVVDPYRYRLRVPGRLLGVLGRLLPRPDLTIVLTGRPEVLLRRKAELPDFELRRQLAVWRRLPERDLRPLYLDCERDVGDLVEQLMEEFRSGARSQQWRQS